MRSGVMLEERAPPQYHGAGRDASPVRNSDMSRFPQGIGHDTESICTAGRRATHGFARELWVARRGGRGEVLDWCDVRWAPGSHEHTRGERWIERVPEPVAAASERRNGQLPFDGARC